MEDQLIDFKTAKLAKEKGFNEVVKYGYNQVNEQLDCFSNRNEDNLWLSTPTQSLLRRWLREVHNIHIELIIDGWGDDKCVSRNLCYRAFIWQVGKPKPGVAEDLGASDYEHILEIALKEALKLI